MNQYIDVYNKMTISRFRIDCKCLPDEKYSNTGSVPSPTNYLIDLKKNNKEIKKNDEPTKNKIYSKMGGKKVTMVSTINIRSNACPSTE